MTDFATLTDIARTVVQPKRAPADKPMLLTHYVYPPIPDRRFDWCAYRDGCEEAGIYGWGKSEPEAIADLLMQEGE